LKAAATEVAEVRVDTLVELVFVEDIQELGEDGVTFVHKVKSADWRWNILRMRY